MVDIASMRIIFESKGWQDLMDKQEKIEKKTGEAGKAAEKSSHVQVEGLKQIRKHWKLLTGAIVGAFYSIAKLSPLFASYLSEFGGILGYIYDTVLIPWGDEIEAILNLGWAFGEWLDEQPVLVQKFVGGLLIGIPIIFGFAIALSVLNSALLGFGVSGGIAAIGPALGKFATFLAGSTIAVTAFGVAMGILTGLIGVWILAKVGILDWVSDVGEGFRNLKEDKFQPFYDLFMVIVGGFALLGDAILAFLGLKSWNDFKNDIEIYTESLNRFKKSIFDVIDLLKQGIPGGGVGYGAYGGMIGAHQTGATITQTGLYKLHQGERVTPSTIAGDVGGGSEINMTFAPTINVGGGFANSYDARKLADDLRRFWMDDVRSVVSGSHR